MIVNIPETKPKAIKNFIVVSQDASGAGWAKMLLSGAAGRGNPRQEHKTKVIFSLIPKEDEEDLDKLEKVGEGIFERIPFKELWKDRVRYKDYLWIFDQNHNSDKCERLIKEGFITFGGLPLSDQMEHDRDFGVSLVEKAGLDSPETQEFTSIDDGLNFLDENFDRAWVFKPDEPDNKSWITTCPDHDNDPKANREIFNFLKSQNNTTPYILQERVKGVEINIEMFIYKGKPFFAQGNFECKRKYNGDYGKMIGCAQDVCFVMDLECKILKDTLWKLVKLPEYHDYTGFLDLNLIVADNKYYFLEFCFDDKTEIMTKNGWKLIKDVPVGTEVATLNKDNGELEYQKTTDLIIQDYNGEMVNLSANSVDVLMTPNHHNWVKVPKHTSKNKKEYQYKEIEAKDLKPGMVLKRDAKWFGQEASIFIVPEYVENHFLGKHNKYHEIIHPAKTLAMDDWLSFLGYYLSEGSLDNGYVVNISQYKFCDKIEENLKRLPFEYRKEKNGFRICSKQLGNYLSQFGKCSDKFVPGYVKELSPRQLEIFLSAYILGDGSIHKRTGQRTIATTSKIMADDLSELILKCGNYSVITERKTEGQEMSVKNGKKYKRKSNIFIVSERKESGDFYLLKKHIKREKYNGKVYCVTTPNHTVYARKNGKAFWSGNCARFGYNSHPNLFLSLAISPFSEIISDWVTGNIDNFSRHFRLGYGASISCNIDVPVQGLPLTFDDETDESRFYPYDTYQEEENEEGECLYYLAGYAEECGVVVAHDYDLKSACEEAYSKFKRIHYPGKCGRTDLAHTDYQTNPIERLNAIREMRLLERPH